MKKIFRSIFAFLICSFIFTVDVSAATDYRYDEKTVISSVETLVNNLVSMNENELKYYAGNSTGWTQNASEVLLNYRENDTLGEFKNFGKTTLEEDGQMLNVTVIARFEKVDLNITTTLTNISGEIIPVEMNFKVVDVTNTTLGARMQNALFNAIIGITSVFIVLMLISFIIYLFKYIPKIQELFTKGDNNSASAALEKAIAQIEEKEELVDDTELVAVIAAAICAMTGAKSDSFVVRSIKKADRKKKRI
jgi:Na+-transporting methylmalonyl-CoA/oxaloacetate decarboxylase gamma subunit